jgi:hypothetical protein
MNQPREKERENKAVKGIAGYVSLQVSVFQTWDA